MEDRGEWRQIVTNCQPSLERLQEYLEKCHRSGKAFSDGFMFLFCSGVDAVGGNASSSVPGNSFLSLSSFFPVSCNAK
jgi:hypothetical protein